MLLFGFLCHAPNTRDELNPERLFSRKSEPKRGINHDLQLDLLHYRDQDSLNIVDIFSICLHITTYGICSIDSSGTLVIFCPAFQTDELVSSGVRINR